MKTIGLWFVVLAACGPSGGGGDDGDDTGDDAPNTIDPKLIAGGGVADAPIAGTLHVHVVEVDSATPIANATVRIEAATPLTATTAANGLATFKAVTGKQTITVTAPGHAAATWIGVTGANATIPLEPSPRTIPTAKVSGTIAGWDNLDDPAIGHYRLGVVLYSFLDDPSAAENSIAQPMSGTTRLNTCLQTPLPNPPPCAWQLNARVGKQVHTAVVVDGNYNTTPEDPSDDTYTLIGYWASAPMTLTAGQQVTNESLVRVTATPTPFSVTFPAAPQGLPSVAAIPELSLDDGSGRIVFPLPTLSAASPATQVLASSGAFAGKYQLVAFARPSATATTPFSTGFGHDVTSPATISPWLGPPAQITNTGGMFSFTAPADSSYRTARLSRGTNLLWSVTILDGSSSFQLPALTPDPLGTGSYTFALTTTDVPSFAPNSFDVPTIKATLARASGGQATFTR